MESEPQRRRVRRAKQSRPIAPGHAEPFSAPPPTEGELPIEAAPDAAAVEPEQPRDNEVPDLEWEPEALPDSNRDGAWLPAGITVLVMVSLLVCAGLVLIASRQ